jgi:Holliday junction resolvase RusA-like endonuclease
MDFYFLRPKSHYRTNGELKNSAPKFMTKTPDLFKCARAVEDAITGIVYLDDSQICEEHIFKHYSSYTSGVIVSVKTVY